LIKLKTQNFQFIETFTVKYYKYQSLVEPFEWENYEEFMVKLDRKI